MLGVVNNCPQSFQGCNMTPLMVDQHEPRQVYELIAQSTDMERQHLNDNGMADYAWLDCQGNMHQVERKQWGELLGDVDSVELQLRKELPNADSTDLLVEGIVKCTQWGLDAYVWDSKNLGYRYSHSFGNAKHPQEIGRASCRER